MGLGSRLGLNFSEEGWFVFIEIKFWVLWVFRRRISSVSFIGIVWGMCNLVLFESVLIETLLIYAFAKSRFFVFEPYVVTLMSISRIGI